MFEILVVEDDKSAARLMQVVLTEAGYNIKIASNGLEALNILDNEYVDLILLDLMMPNMNGHEFITTIRNNQMDIPVIIVTAKLTAEEKYKAFTEGADDFITKPFDSKELLLRIKALLRRSNTNSEQKLVIGKVTLDFASLSVQRDDEVYYLPKKEFYLLFKLLSNPDTIFTRIQLMDEIWGVNTISADTTINVHINRLRNKFKNYPEFTIVAVKGVGYKAVINHQK